MNPKKVLRPILSSLAFAAPMLGLAPARANVAAPVSYEVRVEGNTAHICWGYGNELCHANMKTPLVRKDVATGKTVVVPSHCDENHCVVDECVPPGTYQWGLADPGKCSGTSRVHYQGEGKVTQALAAACAPKVGPERPTPFSGKLPWTPNNVACKGGYCSACTVGGSTDAETVLGASGAMLAAAAVLLARRRARSRRG